MKIYYDFQSPNYSDRHHKIDSILLHHTGGAFPGCAYWLCDPQIENPSRRVSCHYIITRRGGIYQLVPDTLKAWHAGRGAFDLDRDGRISGEERLWNDRSIGIELEAYAPYTYTSRQIKSLDDLVTYKFRAFEINPNNLLGHKEVSPGRKIDPENFDMGLYRTKILVRVSES